MVKICTKIRHLALLLVALLSLAANKANASHFAGGDLYVDMISVDSTVLRYRVTLITYTSCEPGAVNAYTAETVSWRSANAGGTTYSRNMTIGANAQSVQDTLHKLCLTYAPQNSCKVGGSPYPGFARCTFVDTVTLPSAQTDWVFSWSDGSRNTAILNLQGPSGYNIYIEAGINNTGKYWRNSSPRYDEPPLPYLCVNQDNSFSNTPTDPDGDSLYTINMQPYSTAVLPVPYAAPLYSLVNPMNSTTGYTVNGATGEAYFRPILTGKYALAFRTNSYSTDKNLLGNYDELGYTRRDVQVSVLPCLSPPPVLDSILQPGSIGNRAVSICPNVKSSFSIGAHSQSGQNTIILTSDNITSAPGSTFTVTYSAGSATGTFSWTPTTSDIGNHFIKFNARDTTCNPSQPIYLDKSTVILVRVLPGLDAGPDKKICPLGDNPVTITVSGPQTNTYSWRRIGGGNAEFISCLNCPSVSVTPPYDYSYIVSSSDPIFTCKSSDTVLVSVDNSNQIIATQDPLVVCRPGYVHLNSQEVGPPPLSNLPCGILNPQNCTTPDVITLGNLGTASFDTTNSPFLSQEKYHKYQFVINKAEMKNGGIYSGTLKSIAFHSNVPAILGANPLGNLRISLKCTRRTAYPLTASNSDFETGTTVVATVPAYTLTPNDWNVIPFTTPYNWDTSQNLLVDICMGDATSAPNTPTAPGIGQGNVDMTPGQAIQRTSATTDVCSGNASVLRSFPQRPVVRFEYCLAPALPFEFRWAPGTYLADSNVQSPIAYVPRSTNYAVFTRGRNNCLVRDSLHIIVPIHHLTLKNDTSVCVFQPAPLFATGASAGYRWYENGFNTPTTLSCNDCANPISTPIVPGDITYTVVFLDTADCYDTMKMTVHAYPLPIVTINTRDTMIKYGQSVRLIVAGANRYTWTPSGSINDPNIPNPIASPKATTKYIVFGLSQFNCANSDTVTVKVDNRDNLLIPSGFTPNSDGKNDYFRIVNVTFQKLMEFRVFNRWGQEVFTTTDPMKGWDGTWKGVAQDLGNYSYIIRVAYPDGYIENYKGEVTLIR